MIVSKGSLKNERNVRYFINDTEVHENTFKQYYDKEFKRVVINAHGGCKFDYKILKNYFNQVDRDDRKEIIFNGIKFEAFLETSIRFYNWQFLKNNIA